jgi:hypothetical protein
MEPIKTRSSSKKKATVAKAEPKKDVKRENPA